MRIGRVLVWGFAGLVAACGGGQVDGGVAESGEPPAGACDPASAMAPPADAVDVRAFGAMPDDGRDDTDAIQAALDALAPGQWLLFAPGTYEHRSRLTLRVPGAVMWSQGARLHATNAQDQAVMLAADGASIHNFTLTAVTQGRLDAPWQSRIAIFDRAERAEPLRGNVVRGNRIVNGGEPGTATANSASSSGIFVYRAEGFVVARNEVVRSLADGIHLTAGTRHGRVLHNTVRESGDDAIAMVSYLGSGDWTIDRPDAIAPRLALLRERELVRDLLVAYNDVNGPYWGRGISVVGGADITIRANRITRVAVGAGVLLAREAGYSTFGVSNVLVEDNQISQVQTMPAAYTPDGWAGASGPTGHAGIEIHSYVFDDERADASLLAALSVREVAVRRNDVSDTAADGLRLGDGTGTSELLSTTRADGSSFARSLSGGPVGRIELAATALRRTAGRPLVIDSRPTVELNVYCEALTHDGAALQDAACFGQAPRVSGATIGCD